jgi:hypothetical protein
MSDSNAPHHEAVEDTLFRFGDHLAVGLAPLPRTELEATALRVQRALRVSGVGRLVMPPSLKATIREDIVHSTTTGAPLAPTSREGLGRHSSERR